MEGGGFGTDWVFSVFFKICICKIFRHSCEHGTRIRVVEFNMHSAWEKSKNNEKHHPGCFSRGRAFWKRSALFSRLAFRRMFRASRNTHIFLRQVKQTHRAESDSSSLKSKQKKRHKNEEKKNENVTRKKRTHDAERIIATGWLRKHTGGWEVRIFNRCVNKTCS